MGAAGLPDIFLSCSLDSNGFRVTFGETLRKPRANFVFEKSAPPRRDVYRPWESTSFNFAP
jgi:hypothetical protein